MNDDELHRDRELFAQIASGDAAAFKYLFERYYLPVYENAVKLLKSEFWAEEIVQDIFLQLWDNRAQLTQIDHPAAWLYKSTANKCIDRIRKNSRELRAQYAIQNILMSGSTTQPNISLDLLALKNILHQAIAQLPAQQQKAYVLRKENHLSYQEIAQHMGISAHTVRNHLMRAFESIRKYVLAHSEGLAFCWLVLKNFAEM